MAELQALPVSPLTGRGIKIMLSVGQDKLLPLDVCENDTISLVKMRIARLKGFSRKPQHLIWQGKELSRNHCGLSEYGVGSGEIVHIMLNLSDVVDVYVETSSKRSYMFKVVRSQQVQEVKKRLEREGEGAAAEQQLVLEGGDRTGELDDDHLFDDLVLGREPVVHLIAHRQAKIHNRCVGRGLEISVDCTDIESTPQKSPTNSSLYLASPKSHPTSDSKAAVSASAAVTQVKHLNLGVEPGEGGEEGEGVLGGRWRESDGRVRPGLELVARPPLLQLGVNLPPSGWGRGRGDGAFLEPLVGLWKLPETIQELFRDVKAGLSAGRRPVLSQEGMGGTYFMRDKSGVSTVAVFKPLDEEPLAVNNPKGLPLSESGEGLKGGTRVGEGALREAAAFLLDRDSFAGVPPTALALCAHDIFCYNRGGQQKGVDGVGEGAVRPKLGALQKFVKSIGNCEDFGPARFPVQEVHKLSVLDIRLANADRNGENILVCQPQPGGDLQLVPIDHGYSLPEKFEDCTFEWLHWPQAKTSFNKRTVEYIMSLNAEDDISLLRKSGWAVNAPCARVLRVSCMLLKKGAAAGLSPHSIGSIMCRRRIQSKSELELILEDVEKSLSPNHSEGEFMMSLGIALDTYIATKACVVEGTR